MITSIFNKTRPINYIILSILLFVFYIMFQEAAIFTKFNLVSWIIKSGVFVMLLASMMLIQFIYNRNNLVKDNMYGPLLFLLFCVLFPSIFNDLNIVSSLFFLILAFRRLISLKSMFQTKQKLFDASLFILIASLFSFWNILFLIVVFIAIIAHGSSDFKNWLIPIIATFVVASISLLYVIVFDADLILSTIETIEMDLNLNYFKNNIQRVSLAIYSFILLLFFVSSIISYSSRPLHQHTSYKLLYLILIISVAIFIITPNKANSLLAYSFFPICIFGSNLIEKLEDSWIKEAVIGVITLISLAIYFIQL